jgi:glutathione S-transferase
LFGNGQRSTEKYDATIKVNFTERDMILIGQYDSPFVRRVGIALMLYGLAFEHRPWSTFGDADKIRPYNPLVRVPTLVLDNAEVLIESHSILDYIDSLVPADKRLFSLTEPARRQAMKIAALATGLADKAVILFYEKRLHTQVSQTWVDRCRSQIDATMAVLEAERQSRPSDYWFGDRIGHADIAVAAALRFVAEAHSDAITMTQYPALGTYTQRLEALPVFQAVAQRFIPPA